MITITLLILIWAYCMVEVISILTEDLKIEDCSEEDLYLDVLDRQKSRR
tara:strand:- start:553 stop:699 length:147 start_codon:yes stop_codon:yes gene_type:complete